MLLRLNKILKWDIGFYIPFLLLSLFISSVSHAYEYKIIVKISEQKLYLMQGDKIAKTYTVSTSKYGIGNKKRSFKTPLGLHRIAKKIGDGLPTGAMFDSRRRYMGKTAAIYTDNTNVPDDYELTRILWLEGLEEGINKGEGIDSMQRNIYIHGTIEEGLIGTPSSYGCVRMKNTEVIELFNLVSTGTLVEIKE